MVAEDNVSSSVTPNLRKKVSPMRHLATIALASLASLAAAASSQAATYGGFTTAAGALRGTNMVVQGQSDMSNATSFLTVVRSTGVLEYPAFVITAPGVCTATGPDYVIQMSVLSATKTRIKIGASAASCGIRQISFGTPNSRCAYDLTNPNPGTIGSLQGANIVPLAGGLVGMWNATAKFDNAVYVFGTPVQGDLYSRMTLNFSLTFDAGDVFAFDVDTDAIN
jgi:hypothetical protein